MTKHVATCTNTADSHEQETAEEAVTTLESNARTIRQLTGEVAISGNNVSTVGQPTGETAGTQCPEHYRHCNGRKESGGNSTKYTGTSPTMSGRNSSEHTGASPMMPVTREM